MRDALIAILLCGAAVAACENREPAKLASSETSAEASIETAAETIENEGGDTTPSGINIQADSDSGRVELKLPGGFEGSLKLPAGLGADSKFDLDGVGHYPGAKLVKVDVKASETKSGGQARVVLGFTAPGTADQVADWYERALVTKGRSVARTGATITGRTEDGDPMVIAITDGSAGVAQGRITITDTSI